MILFGFIPYFFVFLFFCLAFFLFYGVIWRVVCEVSECLFCIFFSFKIYIMIDAMLEVMIVFVAC